MPEKRFFIAGPKKPIEAVLTLYNGRKSKTATLIVAHGFRGSLEGGGRATLLANQVSPLLRVLRFNFSAGQMLSMQIQELKAVVNFARQEYDGDIFILGRSMGGATALLYTALHPGVKGLILWAVPGDLHKTFYNALGKLNYLKLCAGNDLLLNDERGKLLLTPQFLQEFDTYDLRSAIKAWRGALLVIHGETDEVVPLAEAKELFEAANEPKTLAVLQGADHSFTQHGSEAAKYVAKWLENALG